MAAAGPVLIVSVVSGPSRGAFSDVPAEGLSVGSALTAGLSLGGVGVEAVHVTLRPVEGGVRFECAPQAPPVRLDDAPLREGVLGVGARLAVGDNVLVLEDHALHDSTRATPRTPSGEVLAPTHASSPSLAPVVLLAGKYRLVERLAQGGMGEVHRAEHVALQKPVAVKLMRPELSSDRAFVARFRREAIAASRIGHPNIVSVSDFGQAEDGRFYCVMELVSGETLSRHLAGAGPLPWRRAVALALPVARALAAAHAAGVVHRDLKPDNVMVSAPPGQDEVVKVLDFGVAKVTHGPTDSLATSAGAVIGTPQYMAPEQAAGLAVDAATDVYALGLILFELLEGRPPFTAPTAALVMTKQIHDPAPPLTAGVAPKALVRLVAACLEKAPAARPTMARVASELVASLAEAPPTRRDGVLGAALGVSVVALLLGGWVLTRAPRTGEPEPNAAPHAPPRAELPPAPPTTMPTTGARPGEALPTTAPTRGESPLSPPPTTTPTAPRPVEALPTAAPTRGESPLSPPPTTTPTAPRPGEALPSTAPTRGESPLSPPTTTTPTAPRLGEASPTGAPRRGESPLSPPTTTTPTVPRLGEASPTGAPRGESPLSPPPTTTTTAPRPVEASPTTAPPRGESPLSPPTTTTPTAPRPGEALPTTAPPSITRTIIAKQGVAEVWDGETRLGRTPLAVTRARGAKLELQLRRPGFAPTPLRLDFDAPGEDAVTLRPLPQAPRPKLKSMED